MIEIGDFGWCTCVRLVWASGINWNNIVCGGIKQCKHIYVDVVSKMMWGSDWRGIPQLVVLVPHVNLSMRSITSKVQCNGLLYWIALKEAIWKDATLFNFNFIFLEGFYCVSFGVVFCTSIKMFMNYVEGNNLCLFPCWLCLLSTNVDFAWLL